MKIPICYFLTFQASLTPKTPYSTLQRRFENSGSLSKYNPNPGLQRNNSLKLENLGSSLCSNNNQSSEQLNNGSLKNFIPQRNNDGHGDEIEENIIGSKEEDDRNEVKIIGCRRRIQNRPNKRNSKSKSFSDQRKLRSHSPLPPRKQKPNIELPKPKVL